MEPKPTNRPELIGDRNERIREDLTAGRLPVLPFELELLEKRLREMVGEQNELSKLLGEAMSQTSETWHDNAPADVVNMASITLSLRARNLVGILHSADPIEYPPSDGNQVTVGSIVGIKFSEDSDIEYMFLTGATNGDMPEGIEKLLPEQCRLITLQSPVGVAILDALPGSEVSYEVDKKPKTVRIVSVSQLAVL